MALTRHEAHVLAAREAAQEFKDRAIRAAGYPGSRYDMEVAFKFAMSTYDNMIASIRISEDT